MNQVCPHCDYLFPEPVKRNRKCPFCKQLIKVVQHLHGYKLLTDDQHEIFKYEKKRRSIKNKWLNYSAKSGFYISEETYDRHRKDEFEDPREAISQALITFASKAQKTKDYHKASMACFIIGRMLHGYYDERSFEYWVMKDQLKLLALLSTSDLLYMVKISVNSCCEKCLSMGNNQYDIMDCLKTPPIPLKSCCLGLCRASFVYRVVRDKNNLPLRRR